MDRDNHDDDDDDDDDDGGGGEVDGRINQPPAAAGVAGSFDTPGPRFVAVAGRQRSHPTTPPPTTTTTTTTTERLRGKNYKKKNKARKRRAKSRDRLQCCCCCCCCCCCFPSFPPFRHFFRFVYLATAGADMQMRSVFRLFFFH